MLSVPRALTILLASLQNQPGRQQSVTIELDAAKRTVLESLTLVGDEHLPPGDAPEDVVEGFLHRLERGGEEVRGRSGTVRTTAQNLRQRAGNGRE